MAKITEKQFENHLLGLFAELGYLYENGYEIVPDTDRADERIIARHLYREGIKA